MILALSLENINQNCPLFNSLQASELPQYDKLLTETLTCEKVWEKDTQKWNKVMTKLLQSVNHKSGG